MKTNELLRPKCGMPKYAVRNHFRECLLDGWCRWRLEDLREELAKLKVDVERRKVEGLASEVFSCLLIAKLGCVFQVAFLMRGVRATISYGLLDACMSVRGMLWLITGTTKPCSA